MSETKESVMDADGQRWVYRRVASVLERRRWSSSVWVSVSAAEFLLMTPAELRHVADTLERHPND